MAIYYALGLMSGSSLDGIDLAYLSLDWSEGSLRSWDLLAAETRPLSEMWRARLAHLPQQSALALAKTHTYFGHYLAEQVNAFRKAHAVGRVDYIASHGHTVFHQPERRFGMQIGDGAALAALTACRVICDFRTQDLAMGGEGAPLAPLADAYLFKGYEAYLNLGGIANLSLAMGDGRFLAGDIAPCNQVLDALAAELDLAYDVGGAVAAKGTVHLALLDELFDLPFFERDFPKSLANEWIRSEILPRYQRYEASIEDKLATAVEQVAICLHGALEGRGAGRLLCTGGGAFNTYLLSRIGEYAAQANYTLAPCPEDWIRYKEACLMAILGLLRLEGKANAWAFSTGAKCDTLNGAIYEVL